MIAGPFFDTGAQRQLVDHEQHLTVWSKILRVQRHGRANRHFRQLFGGIDLDNRSSNWLCYFNDGGRGRSCSWNYNRLAVNRRIIAAIVAAANDGDGAEDDRRPPGFAYFADTTRSGSRRLCRADGTR